MTSESIFLYFINNVYQLYTKAGSLSNAAQESITGYHHYISLCLLWLKDLKLWESVKNE